LEEEVPMVLTAETPPAEVETTVSMSAWVKIYDGVQQHTLSKDLATFYGLRAGSGGERGAGQGVGGDHVLGGEGHSDNSVLGDGSATLMVSDCPEKAECWQDRWRTYSEWGRLVVSTMVFKLVATITLVSTLVIREMRELASVDV
jgi:hypothetical protein